MTIKKTIIAVAVLLAVGSLAFLFGPKEEPAPAAPAVGAANTFSKTRPSQAFPMVMRQLSQSLEGWGQVERGDQVAAVNAVMETYRKRSNIAILNSPEFYVQKISETLAGNPSMAKMPLYRIILILAVMEYDFYNGQNKDELAKQTLGERLYEANKKRLQALAKTPR